VRNVAAIVRGARTRLMIEGHFYDPLIREEQPFKIRQRSCVCEENLMTARAAFNDWSFPQ
jgi:hypothetical protein